MEFEPEIEWRFLDELIGYHNNPKTHPDAQIEKIASSIHEFGFTVPLIVDASNVLVCGHGRLAAAKKLNLDKVPVIVRDDLSKTQIKQLRIAENKVSESGWDMEALKLELEELEELGADLELTGIDTSELDELLQRESGEHDESGADEDEVPDVDEARPRCKLGEIWQLGRHRLGCFDSTDVELVRRLLGDRKVDMVWSDPPFNTGIQQGRTASRWGVIENDAMTSEQFGAFLCKFFEVINLYAKSSSHIYVCCHWKSYPYFFQASKTNPNALIVWVKNNFGLGSGYRPQHEFILFWGQLESTTESNVWQINKDISSEYRHPMQKPTELGIRAMKNSSLGNDLIFDPFLGSGMSIIAAQKMEGDRTVYGCEIDPVYCTIVLDRFQQFTGIEPKLIDSAIA